MLPGVSYRYKRIFDLAVASFLFVLFLPFMLLIALVLSAEHRGRPFFCQLRTGRKGSHFTMVKFRTMTSPLAEEKKPAYVACDDPRISRIGRFLRQTGLDELPQLFNILKGDMSLIGPRPQPLSHLAYYGPLLPDYARRHDMRPGLTGLVQILPLRNRTETMEDIAKRVRHDLFYIDHWSFRLDMMIFLRTFGVVLRSFREAFVSPPEEPGAISASVSDSI
jgi:lipopolysaccharide/colanic/teichoic acid biosynthesis glycosyltransferase